MMSLRTLVAMVLFALCTVPGLALARATAPAETPEQKAERLQWWSDARFGMFIHWGLYAVPAGEWRGKKDLAEWFMDSTNMPVGEYAKFARQFNPRKYDPDEWVRVAKDAGMKYIVITSKHHEGFAMWDTKATDYNIARATPYGKGVLKALADAAHRQGLHFATYYSIMDWHHPTQHQAKPGHYNPTAIDPERKREYIAEMKTELRELVTDVGTELFWFDGEWLDWWTVDDGRALYAYLKQLNPNLIINNRIANSRKGSMAGMDAGESIGDYGTPEQEIPARGFGAGVYWESCMTLNDHWGYNKYDDHWKSTQTVVRNLIDIASKGGNYLLNVGPTAEGVLPQGAVDRLADVGRWMHTNGEAIYATQASPFDTAFVWGRVTRKPGKLYLHVFDWPKNGISLRMHNSIRKAYLLAAPDKPLDTLSISSGSGGEFVQLPASAPDPIASVVVVEFSDPLAVFPERKKDERPLE
jgi:alpha-L-fucosidase